MKILTFDTESGGLTKECSLLTAHFEVFDSSDYTRVIDSLSLSMKPPDGKYVVTAQGLSVNKINLVEHDAIAIPYTSNKKNKLNAATEIYEFLFRASNMKQDRLVPMGQSISHDIDLILHYVLSENTWGEFCDHRVIDLLALSQAAKSLNLIPAQQSLSLSSLAVFLGVHIDNALIHTAAYDTRLNREVYPALLKLLSSKN